jgi:hypothetical protein
MELNCEKTEDVLQLSSALGYRKDTLSNWFHAKFNFATQFTDGYMRIQIRIFQYPDHLHPYIFLGLGAEYASKDKHELLYLSPLQNNNGIRPEVS